MKYVYGMVDIWKNMIVGRPKIPLLCLVLVSLLTSLNVFYHAGILGGLIALSFWFFGLPSVFYLIDHDMKVNPTRPKSVQNLLRALAGK
jgi:hypothetical protein